MYWIAAFASAAAIGIGGMYYLKYYLTLKEAKVTDKEKKAVIPLALVFFIATSALMAAFTQPQDSTIFDFISDIVILHSLFYIAIIDFKLKVIPNKVVLVLLGAWAVLTVVHCIVEQSVSAILIDAAIGGVVAGGIFFIGNLISRNGMGMGDVKLMAVTGLFIGMNKAMGMVFWSLLCSLIAGIILMIAKKAKIKTAIPLAPFFLAGSIISNTLYIISGFMEVN